MAVDQRSFSDLVADAVAHLYDLPYLQTHLLSDLLVGERGARRATELRGTALQQALLDAIQALKPTSSAPGCSHGWRIYRYLFLRFVQVTPPQDVARDLAISERQSRRVYREAIDALASVLWDRHGEAVSRSETGLDHLDQLLAPSPVVSAPSCREGGSTGDSVLDQEVQHLAAKGQGSSCDVAEVVQGLRSIVEPLASQYGARWILSLAPDLERIAVDRSIARQILLELLVALLDRRPSQLRLSALSDGGVIRIVLDATSPSLTSSAPPRIDQAADARIAISRRLVEAEGGTLAIQQPSSGSERIEIRLPAAARRRVLVIDDNVDVITVFRRYLESAGFDVVAADSGDEGFRLAKELHPQAITLDVMMASRDGWETLQLLKNDPETQDIPVLVCSVLREEGLARFLGAAALLPKPVTRSSLLSALARCGLAVPAVVGRQSSS
jgi:CheY-like chemotaxis protein